VYLFQVHSCFFFLIQETKRKEGELCEINQECMETLSCQHQNGYSVCVCDEHRFWNQTENICRKSNANKSHFYLCIDLFYFLFELNPEYKTIYNRPCDNSNQCGFDTGLICISAKCDCDNKFWNGTHCGNLNRTCMRLVFIWITSN